MVLTTAVRAGGDKISTIILVACSTKIGCLAMLYSQGREIERLPAVQFSYSEEFELFLGLPEPIAALAFRLPLLRHVNDVPLRLVHKEGVLFQQLQFVFL
jgi:hypothetical protein